MAVLKNVAAVVGMLLGCTLGIAAGLWVLSEAAFLVTGGPGPAALFVMVGIAALGWLGADKAGWL